MEKPEQKPGEKTGQKLEEKPGGLPWRLDRLLEAFVLAFREKALFPEQKRIVIQEYPPEAAEPLKKAGFSREMQDYVLYR